MEEKIQPRFSCYLAAAELSSWFLFRGKEKSCLVHPTY
uniref:Uncharacterized protein n=1 Tax=Rhizophora mucronata TaxID=61149 RepID=A0A2P2QSH9_RHIMU